VRQAHLVNHENLPFDGSQVGLILEDELVRCKKNVELELLRRAEFKLSNDSPRLAVALIVNNIEVGCPCGKGVLPAGHCRKGNDHEEGAVLIERVDEIRQECN
jgi:hypothetical protein